MSCEALTDLGSKKCLISKSSRGFELVTIISTYWNGFLDNDLNLTIYISKYLHSVTIRKNNNIII